MNNTAFILGIASMIAGTCLWVVAIFRALAHTWSLGLAELCLLPAAGFGLVVLGMWLV